MIEDPEIFFNTDEHARTAVFYPSTGEAEKEVTVIIDEGAGNDFSSNRDIVSDNAVIDILKCDISEINIGDEFHEGNSIWVVTGFEGADENVVSVNCEKRRRPAYA
ncbi:MAG: hypothetical protein AB7E04_14155 [Desulfobacteraceae bacterium]